MTLQYILPSPYVSCAKVDHLQSLLSPSRAPPLATSDSHLVPPTSDISFPSPINRVKRPHEKSPSASASEDEIGSKRLRRPPNHLKEFTSEKPWVPWKLILSEIINE